MFLSCFQTITFSIFIIFHIIILSSTSSHATSFSSSYSFNTNNGNNNLPSFNYFYHTGGNTPAATFNVQQQPQQPPIFNLPNLNMGTLPQQQPMNPGTGPVLSDMDAFLQTHNEDRKAVGDPPLVWDVRLAAFAQGWANQRINDCRLVHSHGPYGENIFWGSGDYSPQDIVQVWASEGKNYDRNTNSCTGGMCEHYTQLMWRTSTRLGCAKVHCANGGIFATCNYDPPGNYLGSRPY